MESVACSGRKALPVIEALTKFCLGEVGVEDFEREFVVASHAAKDRPSSAGESIAYDVELALAEFGRGH